METGQVENQETYVINNEDNENEKGEGLRIAIVAPDHLMKSSVQLHSALLSILQSQRQLKREDQNIEKSNEQLLKLLNNSTSNRDGQPLFTSSNQYTNDSLCPRISRVSLYLHSAEENAVDFIFRMQNGTSPVEGEDEEYINEIEQEVQSETSENNLHLNDNEDEQAEIDENGIINNLNEFNDNNPHNNNDSELRRTVPFHNSISSSSQADFLSSVSSSLDGLIISSDLDNDADSVASEDLDLDDLNSELIADLRRLVRAGAGHHLNLMLFDGEREEIAFTYFQYMQQLSQINKSAQAKQEKYTERRRKLIEKFPSLSCSSIDSSDQSQSTLDSIINNPILPFFIPPTILILHEGYSLLSRCEEDEEVEEKIKKLLNLCDTVIVTDEELAKAYRLLCPAVSVLPMPFMIIDTNNTEDINTRSSAPSTPLSSISTASTLSFHSISSNPVAQSTVSDNQPKAPPSSPSDSPEMSARTLNFALKPPTPVRHSISASDINLILHTTTSSTNNVSVVGHIISDDVSGSSQPAWKDIWSLIRSLQTVRTAASPFLVYLYGAPVTSQEEDICLFLSTADLESHYTLTYTDINSFRHWIYRMSNEGRKVICVHGDFTHEPSRVLHENILDIDFRFYRNADMWNKVCQGVEKRIVCTLEMSGWRTIQRLGIKLLMIKQIKEEGNHVDDEEEEKIEFDKRGELKLYLQSDGSNVANCDGSNDDSVTPSPSPSFSSSTCSIGSVFSFPPLNSLQSHYDYSSALDIILPFISSSSSRQHWTEVNSSAVANWDMKRFALEILKITMKDVLCLGESNHDMKDEEKQIEQNSTQGKKRRIGPLMPAIALADWYTAPP